ncbi:MAG: DRTGG domain protein [Candidatus Magnetoglobus multicellularis str. Araruama]|uniref:DRTGG domain protein n=1 Tax=Candidatus Magnetoglobus multicellularis str. Araruama TaxID=890399 RepID=A0A1V1PGM6_9BACT|nr:MAG: DRTGG domain protein [Candidatus Magnetoglobus multicellularis str. Araruama]
MKLKEIRDILDATVVCGEEQMNIDIVSGGGADLMSDVLSATAKGSVLLTGQNTPNVIEICIMAEVGAVVLVRGKQPSKKVVEMAKANSIPILLCHESMFVACGRLYMEGLRGMDGSW